MQKLLFLNVLFFGVALKSFSQQPESDSSFNCSVILNRVSYFWKLDSLANNGFRLLSYKQILNSKVQNNEVGRAFLLNKLGNPNKVWRTNKGVEYVYYVYDRKLIPREHENAMDCLYLSFKFDEYEKHLISIEDGSLER